MLERALGEKEALDVLLDYAADEGETTRGDQGQRLNEAMALHEVPSQSPQLRLTAAPVKVHLFNSYSVLNVLTNLHQCPPPFHPPIALDRNQVCM